MPTTQNVLLPPRMLIASGAAMKAAAAATVSCLTHGRWRKIATKVRR
jgi:hypothetical protein